jgi:hypothetical protein
MLSMGTSAGRLRELLPVVHAIPGLIEIVPKESLARIASASDRNLPGRGDRGPDGVTL